MEGQHVAGNERPRQDVERVAVGLDVRQAGQAVPDRRRFVGRVEPAGVVERAPVRAAHDFERLVLLDGIEGDPEDGEVVAIDRQVRRVLVPRRAPCLAAFLQEDLLVHEPDVALAPQSGDQLADAGLLEEAAVGRRGAGRRVVEVLDETARVLGRVEVRRPRSRIGQAPLVGRFTERQLSGGQDLGLNPASARHGLDEILVVQTR